MIKIIFMTGPMAYGIWGAMMGLWGYGAMLGLWGYDGVYGRSMISVLRSIFLCNKFIVFVNSIIFASK